MVERQNIFGRWKTVMEDLPDMIGVYSPEAFKTKEAAQRFIDRKSGLPSGDVYPRVVG
jgi:Mlc titration factor MtfA (ptsG expression regulator)